METTTPLKVGELFAGYGGLGMAVKDVWPHAEVAWVSEFDKGPSKVLAHRFPDAPNLGDITKIKWTPDCPTCGDLLALYWNDEMPEGRGYYCRTDGWFPLDLWRSEPGIPEPIEVLTGGSPCQDLSHAGKRQGMTDGTRSNLWVAMREAIATIRPRLVVWENVRGAYSAQADSAVEPCPGCVGDRRTDVLRALGRVLGDLSELRYDAVWCGLRAADVGAPHGRFRVFVLAWDATADTGGLGGREAVEHDGRHSAEGDWRGVPDQRDRDALRAGPDRDVTLFKTPTSQLAINGGSQHPDKRKAGGHGPTLADEVEHLLPTPAVNDMGEGKTVEKWDAWTDAMKAKHGNGNGHGKSLAIEAQRLTAACSYCGEPGSPVGCENCGRGEPWKLLPTPEAADASGGRKSSEFGGKRPSGAKRSVTLATAIEHKWGDYAAAIQRWERVTGRPAPEPTQMSAKGNPQLSARFTEWLMGIPAGWITDVPGVTRNEALKMCGNGVVPQQGAAALRWMLAQIEKHA